VRDRHGSLFGCPPLLAKTKTDAISRWAAALEQRRGYWKAVVAIAAKTARLAWAVLTKGEAFKLPA
jgi:transposase